MRNILTLLLMISFLSVSAQIFVASDVATDAGSGTLSDPYNFKSLIKTGNAYNVQPGDTVFMRGGKYLTGAGEGFHIWMANGTSSSHIVFMPYDYEPVVLSRTTEYLDGVSDGYVLLVQSNYITVCDIIVTMESTHRSWGLLDGNEANDIVQGGGIIISGIEDKLINCITYNTGSVAISSPTSMTGGDIYGNITIYPGGAYPNNGWGHGLYFQNDEGAKHVDDNIFVKAFGIGVQFYSAVGSSTAGSLFSGNVAIMNGSLRSDDGDGGSYQFLIASSGGADDLIMENNHAFMNDRGTGFSIGYTSTYDSCTMINNYVQGSSTGIGYWNYRHVVSRNNTIVQKNLKSYRDYDYVLAYNGYPDDGGTYQSDIDSNFYWTDSSIFNPIYADNKDGNTFADWQAEGFDPNGTVNTITDFTTVPNRVDVFPNDYEDKRANIVIHNHQLSSTVSVDVSNVLTVGDDYWLYDVEDLRVPIMTGTYAGGDLNIPTNQTSCFPLTGTAIVYYPTHSNADFGTFLLLGRELNVFAETKPQAEEDFTYIRRNYSNSFNVLLNDFTVDQTAIDSTSVNYFNVYNMTISSFVNGNVTFTLTNTAIDSASFYYTFEDIDGVISDTTVAYFKISIPNATGNSGSVDVGGTVRVPILYDDLPKYNLDTSSVVFIDVLNGSIYYDQSDGSVDFTQDGTQSELAGFKYTVKDIYGELSDTARVTISVLGVTPETCSVEILNITDTTENSVEVEFLSTGSCSAVNLAVLNSSGVSIYNVDDISSGYSFSMNTVCSSCESGVYTVRLTSGVVNVETTFIYNVSRKLEILSCIPDTTYDETSVTFYSPVTGVVNISVTNISGDEVLSLTYNATEGENNSVAVSLDGMVAGNYIITLNDGSSVVSCVVTKKDTPPSMSIVSYSPNPTYDIVTVVLYSPGTTSIDITVINSSGVSVATQIFSAEVGDTSIDIDLSALPTGVYNIEFNDGTTTVSCGVTKEDKPRTLEIISYTPNPTFNIVTITFYSPVDGNISIVVTNSSGQEVLSKGYSAGQGESNRVDVDLTGNIAGIYTITLDSGSEIVSCSVAKQDEVPPPQPLNIISYTESATVMATVEFYVPVEGTVSVEVFNSSGVAVISDNYSAALGNNTLKLDFSSLLAGNYNVTLNDGTTSVSCTITKSAIEEPVPFELVDASPDPTVDLFAVKFNNPSAGNVRAEVFDDAGRSVMKDDFSVVKGLNKIVVNLAALTPATYKIVIDNGESSPLKVTVTKQAYYK